MQYLHLRSNEELGYFTLKLKCGFTAYAPYDPISSPTVDGEVTFNYPGVLPKTGTKAPADGWYYLRAMNNYLNLDASGNAEFRNKPATTGNQVYYVENLLRSPDNVRMVLNASGEKNAEFRFIPTSAPDKPIIPAPAPVAAPVPSDSVTAVPSQTSFAMNGKNMYWDGAAGQAVFQPGAAYTGTAQ